MKEIRILRRNGKFYYIAFQDTETKQLLRKDSQKDWSQKSFVQERFNTILKNKYFKESEERRTFLMRTSRSIRKVMKFNISIFEIQYFSLIVYEKSLETLFGWLKYFLKLRPGTTKMFQIFAAAVSSCEPHSKLILRLLRRREFNSLVHPPHFLSKQLTCIVFERYIKPKWSLRINSFAMFERKAEDKKQDQFNITIMGIDIYIYKKTEIYFWKRGILKHKLMKWIRWTFRS